MRKHHLSDRGFAAVTILFALVLWAVLQSGVNTACAAEAAPRPITYRATIGVGVGFDSSIDDGVCATVPAQETTE